jgi:MFS family permease
MDTLTAGFRFLWQEKGMLAVVLLFAVTNALNDVEAVLVPLLARVALRMPADRFGLLASFVGSGTVVGTLLIGSVGHRIRNRALVICGSMIIFGCAIMSMGLAQEAWELYASYSVFGFTFIIAELVSSTLWLHMVPADMRGRVFSVMSTLAMGLNPLGYLLAGVLGSVWGVRVGILIGGGAVVIVSVGALLVRPVWSLNRRVDVAPSGADVGVKTAAGDAR